MQCPFCTSILKQEEYDGASVYCCPNENCRRTFLAVAHMLGHLPHLVETDSKTLSAPSELLAILELISEPLSTAWKDFSNEELSKLFYRLLMSDAELNDLLYRSAVDSIYSLDGFRELSESELHLAVESLYLSFSLSIGNEFIRRFRSAEDRSGHALMKLLGSSEITIEELDKVGRLRSFKRIPNPDGFGSRAEEEQENRSIFLLALLEIMKKSKRPTIDTLEGIRSLLEGHYSKIVAQTSNAIDVKIQSLYRHRSILEEFVKKTPFPVEKLQQVDDQILIAEIYSAAKLTEREQHVLECLYTEGLSKKEAAQRLNLTPGRITQLHGSALTKLDRASERK